MPATFNTREPTAQTRSSFRVQSSTWSFNLISFENNGPTTVITRNHPNHRVAAVFGSSAIHKLGSVNSTNPNGTMLSFRSRLNQIYRNAPIRLAQQAKNRCCELSPVEIELDRRKNAPTRRAAQIVIPIDMACDVFRDGRPDRVMAVFRCGVRRGTRMLLFAAVEMKFTWRCES